MPALVSLPRTPDSTDQVLGDQETTPGARGRGVHARRGSPLRAG